MDKKDREKGKGIKDEKVSGLKGQAESAEEEKVDKAASEAEAAADETEAAGTEGAAGAEAAAGTATDCKAGAAADGKAGVEDESAKRIAELESKNSELTDRMLRIQAEAENYKKRVLRESEDAVSFANKGLVTDLIPTLDSLDLAIAHAQKNVEDKAVADGICLVRTTLLTALRKWGLALIETEGKEFDPSVHEACLVEENGDVETDTVAQELQKGYMLNGRVVRAAKVKVYKSNN